MRQGLIRRGHPGAVSGACREPLGLHRDRRRGDRGRFPRIRPDGVHGPAGTGRPVRSDRSLMGGGGGTGHHRPRGLSRPHPHQRRDRGLSVAERTPEDDPVSPGRNRWRAARQPWHWRPAFRAPGRSSCPTARPCTPRAFRSVHVRSETLWTLQLLTVLTSRW
jgi:hypothetical protein